MKVLFVHQNCPGQFRHLAPALAARGDEVVFVTQAGRPDLPGVRKVDYAPHRKVTPKIHPYLAGSEAAVLNGQAVARLGFQLRSEGFLPDVMVGNPGWGETLFLKDVWPEARLLSLCEFFYRGRGSDVGFDPEFDLGPDGLLRARARSGVLLTAIEAADAGYAPTEWQRAQFPEVYRPRIEVIHDGIDTGRIAPDPAAAVALPDGTRLTRGDEVLTYIARNLEPYRGFHSFMRALPAVLKARPEAHVVIVGGDEVSYGSRAPQGRTWREVMLEETGPLPARVHFTGRVPYAAFLDLIRVSSVHAYFTYPFVLSWSVLEVMAAGGLVVGSATPPVEEVIADGENGLLVDFFDREAIAGRLIETLARRREFDGIRAAARETVRARYALETCLPRQIGLIDRLATPGFEQG